jgi:hypothetical protein
MREESSLRVNRRGLAYVLLRVNRRGLVLLLSLSDCGFDRCGGMVGLVNISTPERVSHYSHPRPVVESNDREPRLFMVVPKTKQGSPPKNIEATHKRGAVKRATNCGY